MKEQIKSIHFIGINGIGMSSLSNALYNIGYMITGSDYSKYLTAKILLNNNFRVVLKKNMSNIYLTYFVVFSTAIKKNNIEIEISKILNIPIIKRGILLSEITFMKNNISISGSHGKTTTTGLIASVLSLYNLNVDIFIGGNLKSINKNYNIGLGNYSISEIDESDKSFLYILPFFNIITNIDNDHINKYDNKILNIKHAFITSVKNIAFYGSAFLCTNNKKIREITKFLSIPIITYGLTEESNIFGYEINFFKLFTEFKVSRNYKNKFFSKLNIKLSLTGIHNLLNSLAAISIATELGIKDIKIKSAMASFNGVSRRFDYIGKFLVPTSSINIGYFDLFEDYGHHPSEIFETLKSMRNYHFKSRTILIFQPHRCKRIIENFENFLKILSLADLLILTNIYSLKKENIQLDSSEVAKYLIIFEITELILLKNICIFSKILMEIVGNKDSILIMGAGSINRLRKKISLISK